MTTLTDFGRGNFNGDFTQFPTGSLGDLVLFDDFGDKAIWLENGNGGRLATSPDGFNLPFTGPTWHIVAAVDFDRPFVSQLSPPAHQIPLLRATFCGKTTTAIWRFGRATAATSIRSRPALSIKRIYPTRARVGTSRTQMISTSTGRRTFFSSTTAAS
jgi:hypothetical protein